LQENTNEKEEMEIGEKEKFEYNLNSLWGASQFNET
jgi:hypothetical protein